MFQIILRILSDRFMSPSTRSINDYYNKQTAKQSQM